jgi:hypothetical protein
MSSSLSEYGVNVISSTEIINGTTGTTISNPFISKRGVAVGDINNSGYSFIANEYVDAANSISKIQLSRINNATNNVDISSIFLEIQSTTPINRTKPLIQTYNQPITGPGWPPTGPDTIVFGPPTGPGLYNDEYLVIVSCIEVEDSDSTNIRLYVCNSSFDILKSFIVASETNNIITSYEINIFDDVLYLCYSVNNITTANIKIKTCSITSLLSNAPSVKSFQLSGESVVIGDAPPAQFTINRISFDVYSEGRLLIAYDKRISGSETDEIVIVRALLNNNNDNIDVANFTDVVDNAFNPKLVMLSNNDNGYLVFNTMNDEDETHISIMYFQQSNATNPVLWTEINPEIINTSNGGSQTSPSISVNDSDQLCISYTTNKLISLSNYPVNDTPTKDIVIAIVDNDSTGGENTYKRVSIHQSTFWNTQNNNEDNSFIVANGPNSNNTYNVLYTTNNNKLTLMTINYINAPLIHIGSFLSTYKYLEPELLEIYNNLKVRTVDGRVNPYTSQILFNMPINKPTNDYIFENLLPTRIYQSILLDLNFELYNARKKKDLNSDLVESIIESGYPYTTKSQIEELKSLEKTMISTSFYYITLNTLKLVELMVSSFDDLNFTPNGIPENVYASIAVNVYTNYKYILKINDKNDPLFFPVPFINDNVEQLSTVTGTVILFQALYKIISEGNITQYGPESFSKIFQLLQSSTIGTTINEYIGNFLGGPDQSVDSFSSLDSIINIIKNLLFENISLSSIRSLYNKNHMYELDENQQWIEVKPLPEPCYYSTTVSFNKKICVIGGISCLLENFLTKPYASSMYMGTPTQAMRDARTALYSNRNDEDKAAIITRISLYSNNKWSYRDGTNINRYCASSVVFKNKIHLIGGHTSFDTTFQHFEQKTTNTVEIKENNNFAKTSWVLQTNGLNKSRAGCSSIVFNEKIFVIGGYDDLGFGVTEIETLGTNSTTWTTIEVDKDVTDYDFYGYSCSAAVFKNAIYILDCNGRVFKLTKNATGTRYTLTNRFIQPYLSVSRNNKNSKLVRYNNKLYIVGGNEYSSSRTFQYFNGTNWFQGGDILPEKSFLLESVVA